MLRAPSTDTRQRDTVMNLKSNLAIAAALCLGATVAAAQTTPAKPAAKPAAKAAKPAAAKPAEDKPADAKAGEGKAKDAKAPAEPLYLQVGAFQKSSDADNLKARLALIGMDAAVLEVEVPDKGKIYRVRVGPFSSVDEMNRARKQLSDNGVQTAPVKGK